MPHLHPPEVLRQAQQQFGQQIIVLNLLLGVFFQFLFPGFGFAALIAAAVIFVERKGFKVVLCPAEHIYFDMAQIGRAHV